MLVDERPEWVDDLDSWHVLTGGKILVVILLAVILTWLSRRLIRRTVRGMHTLGSSMGYKDRRSEQRTRTISAVLRSVAGTVIWTVAVIAILSLLGVNIAAFVAVSSIVGAALAFGAQQIVRDLLAGFFMFTEDQYGVGDSVDLGLAEGTVEEVSLRVTRLRGVDGKIWYVPHGQITRVANLSQEWALVVVDVPVRRDADVAAATAAILRAADQVVDDPELGPELLERPRVLGVQDVLDDRLVLRLVVRTKPAARFEERRALQARIASAIAAGDVPAPVPGPAQVVLVPGPGGPDQPAPPAAESAGD